ncbi:hypothetical protein E9993_12705 [Labilibacter sediminis]|nr:hypothetical protein E9993_12705 [Labilibacter sediminis]
MKHIVKLFMYILAVGVIGCNHPLKEDTKNTKETDRNLAIKQWKDMKFGMFIHWGIYSVPAGMWNGKQIEKLGEQIQRHAYIPSEEYVQIASQFNPVHFNADSIVTLAKSAGMNYIVLTAKHHDGFCMFESAYTDFDIIDASPYKKDILKELANACQKHGLKIGIYYSTPDWHFNGPSPEVNPHDGKISVFSKVSKANEDYQVNQLRELMTNYGDIVELFFDMGEPTPAQSKRFANTIHELQPNCVINGRIMNNQGDFLTMPDNHVPDVPIDSLAWETPGTFYHTWGYKSWVKGAPVKVQVKKQINKLAQIVARGGNFLLNIGPKSDGTVVQYEKDVLSGISAWMNTNSEAIYHTGTTPFLRLPFGECTTKDNKLYFFVADWPENNKITIPGLENDIIKAYAINNPEKSIPFASKQDRKVLDLSNTLKDPNLTVIAVEYEGKLNVIHPAEKQNEQGDFSVSGNNAIKHGKYGRESYRSILKDYYRSWLLNFTEKGIYDVYITYDMKYDEKDFILEIAGNKIDFTLTGDGSVKAVSTIIDGNEEIQNPLNSTKVGKYNRVSIGQININKPLKTSLYLKQGQEFEFKATTVEYKKQDPKYRSMNINIQSIELIPSES